MNKVLIVIILVIGLDSAALAQHKRKPVEAAATVNLRQNDSALCGQPFYDDLYALTVEIFANGAASVKSEDYAAQVFALVRSSPEFVDYADAFVDHIKDIPKQLVQIILEDPKVLDSCANFSVALVGPP